jgi:hypothetical protein
MVVLVGDAIFGSYTALLIVTNGRPGNLWLDWRWVTFRIAASGLQIVGFALLLAAAFADRQQRWRPVPPPEYLPREHVQSRPFAGDFPPDAIREG